MNETAGALYENIPGNHKEGAIFKVLTCFLICGFIGWIFETLIVAIETGHFTDRGFLFIMKPISYYFPVFKHIPVINVVPFTWGLPFILIYGIGGTIICIFLKRWADSPVKLFFIGMISLTLLELGGSYVTEFVVHKRLWDYSARFMNFEGRICLRSSLVWGVLSVIVIRWIYPHIISFYSKIRWKPYFKGIVLTLTVYVLICAVVKYFINPNIISEVGYYIFTRFG